jgi:hypothetical protein
LRIARGSSRTRLRNAAAKRKTQHPQSIAGKTMLAYRAATKRKKIRSASGARAGGAARAGVAAVSLTDYAFALVFVSRSRYIWAEGRATIDARSPK